MSNVMEAPEQMTAGVVRFNITNAEIAELKEKYLPLTINGLEDKEGYKLVYEARQYIKRTRVALTKYAKEMREDAQAWVKKVIAEEKRVVGELELIEAHLQAEEDRIDAEKERLRKEAEDRENARMQERLDALAQYGFAADYAQLKALDDESFKKLLDHAEAQWQEEQARKAEEERQAQLERERIERERAELEELRAKQAEAQRIIDEQNKQIRKNSAVTAIMNLGYVLAENIAAYHHPETGAYINLHVLENFSDDDEVTRFIMTAQNNHVGAMEEKRRREEEIERARQEAAERAREEERQRIEWEARQKAEAEEKARIAAERKAARMPDKEKLLNLIDQYSAVKVPELKTEESMMVANQFFMKMNDLLSEFKTTVNKL